MNSSVKAKYKLSDRLQRGEVIASRYVVEELWRDHPLGELYRCRDLGSGQRITLQRLRREFAEPGVGDRLFDTRMRAALGTSLIPDILDHGADFDGRQFVVSRARHAVLLAELERPMAFTEVLAIVERVASALIPAHAERLVHGGIEPCSVMIERDRSGQPRVVGLLGFGLVPALVGGSHKSRSLALVMSPTHVAPELVRGAAMTPAADVYALGILLWELIYGAPPFRGPTLRVLDAQQRLPLPHLELPLDVPPAFDWVLRRMLAKNPVDRFPDAAAVVEQLRAFACQVIPDLTRELDPDPQPELDEDDGDRTIIYRRRAPSRAAVVARVHEPSAAAVSFPRPQRAKWTAIVTVAAAGMLIVLQALAGTPPADNREQAKLVDSEHEALEATAAPEESVPHVDAVPPRRAIPDAGPESGPKSGPESVPDAALDTDSEPELNQPAHTHRRSY